MSDSADGLGSLLLYMFFASWNLNAVAALLLCSCLRLVNPACGWILTPGRFSRKRSVIYAILFWAFFAAGKLSLEWMERGPNNYQLLGVTRNSSMLEIKRAYKKISLELHPDKNPSPEAADQFATMKDAYDVLLDLEMRPIYDKLGPDAIKANKRLTDEYQIIMEIALFYIMWGVFAFLLTMGKSAGSARNWIFTGEIAMMLGEVTILLASNDHSVPSLPTWFFPSVTEHEVIWIMRALFPAFMSGCRSLGNYLYVDVDKQTRDMLLALKEGHQDVLMVLRDIQVHMSSLQQQGGGGGGAVGGGAVAGGNFRQAVPRATPTGKLKAMEERMKVNASGVNDIAAEIKGTEKKGNNSFWIFLLVYVAIYYATS